MAVALSAQATDVGVNKATKDLFKIADTPEKMLALGEQKLQSGSGGFVGRLCSEDVAIYVDRFCRLFELPLEPAFLKRLEAAPSNLPDYGDGRVLYQRRVAPARPGGGLEPRGQALPLDDEPLVDRDRATLGEPLNATLAGPPAATVLITNDDPQPTDSVSSTAASVGESPVTVDFTITLSAPASNDVGVDYATVLITGTTCSIT